MYAALFGFCLLITVGAVVHHATTTSWRASSEAGAAEVDGQGVVY